MFILVILLACFVQDVEKALSSHCWNAFTMLILICRLFCLLQNALHCILFFLPGSFFSVVLCLFFQVRLPLDDTPISAFRPSHLRHALSLVSQEPDLFSGTIAENIRYGAESATLEVTIYPHQLCIFHAFLIPSFRNEWHRFVVASLHFFFVSVIRDLFSFQLRAGFSFIFIVTSL